MLRKKIVVGPFQCNCHILACPVSGEALVIDPGDELEKILQEISVLKTASGEDIKVKALLHTHAHLDHIGGTRRIKEILKVPQIFLHQQDHDLYQNLRMQGQFFGFDFEDPCAVDRFFQDEEIFQFGNLKIKALHTPGHSPGSVSFCLKEDSQFQIPETVFSGDTLFERSIGRTDLWGGDQELLLKSIRQRLFTLDDDIPVCPGHGPDTQIGLEKRENPFF